jgi:hypothetical protein
VSPDVITETALIGVLALAAGAEATVATLLLSGKWKISTGTRPKPTAATPAAAETFRSVPAMPATGNGSEPAAGAL